MHTSDPKPRSLTALSLLVIGMLGGYMLRWWQEFWGTEAAAERRATILANPRSSEDYAADIRIPEDGVTGRSKFEGLDDPKQRAQLLDSIALSGKETNPEKWKRSFLELAAYIRSNGSMTASLAWATFSTGVRGMSADELLNVLSAPKEIMEAADGLTLITRDRVGASLVAILCDKFLVSARGEELMEKLLSNPVTLRLGEEVCSSIRGSAIASHYPDGVAALPGLPEGARRAVEQKVVEDLSYVDRHSALEFVLLHAATITPTDPCMQGVFNDAWFLQNSEQVSVLIRDAPLSDRRDFLIGEMVRAMAATLPEEAKAWVEAITNPGLKQNAMDCLRASHAQ